jgi:hypothetical protein
MTEVALSRSHGELFPKVSRDFASQELEALGGKMEAMFDELKGRSATQVGFSIHEQVC